jgi:hypothetical protein
LAAGCATATGTFQPDGFHHNDLPVVVRYHDPSSWRFVGPDWRIDNFVLDEDGKPGDAKSAQGYVENRAIDYLGDGQPYRPGNAYIYDLKLVNRRTDATMWLQEIPLPMHDKDRSLQALLDNLVESISGTGFYTVRVGYDRSKVRAKTFGARIVQSAPVLFGKFTSLDATIEVVNLDQLKVDPTAKAAVVRVVLVRTAYTQAVDSYVSASIVTVLGCESKARDFESTSADFERFLTSVQLGPMPAKVDP